MNYEIQTAIQSELQSGEKLLWSGQPAQGLRLRAADAFLSPFSLFWAGFAFYWEWSVLQEDAPGFFALWGIPFVLIGAYILVGRFFVDAWQRSRTYYALTPERAIIMTVGRIQQVKSLPLRTLQSVSLRQGPGVDGNYQPRDRQWLAWHGVVLRLRVAGDVALRPTGIRADRRCAPRL